MGRHHPESEGGLSRRMDGPHFFWLPFPTMPRIFVVLLLFSLVVPGHDGFAQQADTTTENQTQRTSTLSERGDGTVVLTEWPASLGGLLREMGKKAPYLLPKVDSLALDYRYAATDSTSRWSFVLGWQPGDRVLYKGDVLSRQSAPANLKMVNVELRVQVRAEGTDGAQMLVAVDSMRLSPYPSIYSFEVTVPHTHVFLNTSAEEARRMFESGITLDSVVVERMGFGADGATSTSDASSRPNHQFPSWSGEHAHGPQAHIAVGWGIASGSNSSGKREGHGSVRSRTKTVGRRAEHTRRRDDPPSNESAENDSEQRVRETADEEDENPTLRIPAILAIATVGLLAYPGGTVGMYSRGDTPIGLSAGYRNSEGGMQLQAAVSGSVIAGEPAQKLTVKGLRFHDVFSTRLQPSLGFGFQLDPTAPGTFQPSLSIGFATDIERLLLLGGFDLLQQTPELAIVYKFRDGSGASNAGNEGAGE